MSFDNNGQNSPDMLVLQFPPGEKDLKIVHPVAIATADLEFPMPAWGKRRCSNVGSGVEYGGALPDDPPTSECNGNGECAFDREENGHEVYKCNCNADYFGDWLGENCDFHVLDVGAVLFYVLIVGTCCATFWKRKHSKWKNAHRRELAQKEAERTMETALAAQKDALELKKQGLIYPTTWKSSDDLTRTITIDGEKKPMPAEGLIPVSQKEKEYWDVYDELTRAPDPRFKQTNGQESDLRGMHDAWITKLERIQNIDLYANYDTMKDKLKRGNGVDSREVNGWHGTGNFDAANIYEDKQDGFMMQFASAGQWGRGLYFADEAGYSDIYASAAAGMPDKGESRGFRSDDEKEMMLATLLLGNVIEMDRDKNEDMRKACQGLKTPPAIAGCDGKTTPSSHDEIPTCTAPPTMAGGHKYNTVRGYTQTDQRHPDGTWTKNAACPRSKVWIVYENGQTFLPLNDSRTNSSI